MTSKRYDLAADLAAVQAAGALADARLRDGRLDLPDGTSLTLPQARAYLDGVRLGLAAAPTRDPLRRALARTGQASVRLPRDPSRLRQERNRLFTTAYALGLKGRVHVRVDRAARRLTATAA